MERARWKVRFCVLLTLLIAIIVGTMYYVKYVRSIELSEGVLISILEEETGLNENGTK